MICPPSDGPSILKQADILGRNRHRYALRRRSDRGWALRENPDETRLRQHPRLLALPTLLAGAGAAAAATRWSGPTLSIASVLDASGSIATPNWSVVAQPAVSDANQALRRRQALPLQAARRRLDQHAGHDDQPFA